MTGAWSTVLSASYMRTADDWLPNASWAGDGGYFVSSSLATATPTTIKKPRHMQPVVNISLTNTKVLLVCPLPRYVSCKPCSDLFDSEDCEDEWLEIQDQHISLFGEGGGVVLTLTF
jgi:hypothetical protein